ncbi:MAG: Nramp family divalent metal transporter [Gaiellales bacterium]
MALRRARYGGLAAAAAVVGPGVLAGLSDDDPAGVTTYSILGAEHGYRLLWVLVVSTVALIAFHELGARLGLVTGHGLMRLVRSRYGPRATVIALAALVAANLGTTCAELAGLAASFELVGISRVASVPVGAVLITVLVIREGFHRLEHLLLALSTVFVTYVAAGLLAHPDWGAAARGVVVPSVGGGSAVSIAIAATVGTTLAPWGLAFIQSYTVDKRLSRRDLPIERVDVVVGAILTGVIGAFVVIACAATLHRTGAHIDDARDAAVALEPVAGQFAALLFGVGLLGASLMGAAVLPLSTAYSVSEALGGEPHLDDGFREAPLFYGAFAAVLAAAAAFVLIPGIPLIRVLYLSQVLNAVLLLPLLAFMLVLGRDAQLVGGSRTRGTWWALELAGAVVVTASVALLAVSSLR